MSIEEHIRKRISQRKQAEQSKEDAEKRKALKKERSLQELQRVCPFHLFTFIKNIAYRERGIYAGRVDTDTDEDYYQSPVYEWEVHTRHLGGQWGNRTAYYEVLKFKEVECTIDSGSESLGREERFLYLPEWDVSINHSFWADIMDYSLLIGHRDKGAGMMSHLREEDISENLKSEANKEAFQAFIEAHREVIHPHASQSRVAPRIIQGSVFPGMMKEAVERVKDAVEQTQRIQQEVERARQSQKKSKRSWWRIFGR